MMKPWHIALSVALLYLAWTFGDRWMSGARQPPRSSASYRSPYGEDSGALRVLQFYASPAVLMEGQSAVLCYGVLHAISVRIEPGVEPVTPSPNRCLEIAPRVDTTYTLIAQGAQGDSATAAFNLRVRPNPATQPKIVYFTPAGQRIDRGQKLTSLCFQAENAEQVLIDPPVMPATSAPRGCFYVAPPQTTTYTLTAVGSRQRHVERRVTVTVK